MNDRRDIVCVLWRLYRIVSRLFLRNKSYFVCPNWQSSKTFLRDFQCVESVRIENLDTEDLFENLKHGDYRKANFRTERLEMLRQLEAFGKLVAFLVRPEKSDVPNRFTRCHFNDEVF